MLFDKLAQMVRGYADDGEKVVCNFRQYGLNELYNKNGHLQLQNIINLITVHKYVATMRCLDFAQH